MILYAELAGGSSLWNRRTAEWVSGLVTEAFPGTKPLDI